MQSTVVAHRQELGVAVRAQRKGSELEQAVSRRRGDEVIREADVCLPKSSTREGEQRLKAPEAMQVAINVDATDMEEHKVAAGVCALDVALNRADEA